MILSDGVIFVASRTRFGFAQAGRAGKGAPEKRSRFFLLKIRICSIALEFMSRWSLLELGDPNSIRFDSKSFIMQHCGCFLEILVNGSLPFTNLIRV